MTPTMPPTDRDTAYGFTFHGQAMQARASGALWWPSQRMLAVSDLHLGKALRLAQKGGATLPPYEVEDTLQRLEAEIRALSPARILCLGDSFDDHASGMELSQSTLPLRLAPLMAGRKWIWITGNHDPAPLPLPGQHLAEWPRQGIAFRHIASQNTPEISGHYHPKARLPMRGSGPAKPCFLLDDSRLILPAFGTYTGGLSCTDPALSTLFGPKARAILTGQKAIAIPMPR